MGLEYVQIQTFSSLMGILKLYLLLLLLYEFSPAVSNDRDEGEKTVQKENQLFENESLIPGLGKNLLNPKNNKESDKPKECPGGRVRKEIRRMSPEEWKAFTDAVNVLKQTGEYNKMAAVHRGEERISHTHYGPNFLGWHRIYLLFFESLLRKVNPCVTIPYWDATLDYAMENPQKSVLWTDEIFGNGFDNVTSGPFKNWVTGQGQNLTRFLSTQGRLVSLECMNTVITRPSHSIITVYRDDPASIEFSHNMLHAWVGGQMGCFPSAAEDPVFWTLHSFIDCWWQKFRKNLLEKHGIRAINDYPNVNGTHSAYQPMAPFTHLEPFLGYKNQDGYRDDLLIYQCEEFPSCNKTNTDCKSPLLYCDLVREICVSKEATVKESDINSSRFSVEHYLSNPTEYDSVTDSCGVKYGTTELQYLKAIEFPMDYLPRKKK